MAIRILDIGQCGFDGPRMAALWSEALGATVDRSPTWADALLRLAEARYDIILVNRILASDGSSGMEVIRQLIAMRTQSPVMLVSDRPEAQDAAVALGAVRGFGKADLGEPFVLDLVASVATQK